MKHTEARSTARSRLVGAATLVTLLLASSAAIAQEAGGIYYAPESEAVRGCETMRATYKRATIAEAIVGLLVGVGTLWLSQRISKLEARLDASSAGR